ncbi:PREDICTED: mitotic spindle-associated MMXD complex subunit MIP18 [Charadrius vociferus]|nr:PREDICTED: mitotic spindle-associated MMXD complex subunit MIP18 [Charadrius vociferus]
MLVTFRSGPAGGKPNLAQVPTVRSTPEGRAGRLRSAFLNPAHLIRSINDPEHPLTLEELNVVEQVRVKVDDAESTVAVAFTPTIPHCSMATLIGLSIKVKLIRSLPERFKLDVHITPGTHASEHAVNKQLADKERVAAALENSHLLEVVNQCLSARS